MSFAWAASMLDSFPMPVTADARPLFPRLMTGGKWLGACGEKWLMRGVSYGPFKPNSRGEPFPVDDRLVADLAHVRQLGFNTVRLYELPTPAMLRAAAEHGLRLLVGIPWTDHVDFLRTKAQQREIQQRIVAAVTRYKDESCVAGFLVGNEIEKTLVRWMGPARVRGFLEALIEAARTVAPEALFSYASYPSTEYLIPRNVDFLSVNLYLEQRENLAAYLQRLQNLAGNKPLVITEFGLDVTTHGEPAQAETRRWFQQSCDEAAVAGTVWFSYTDEWFRGGEAVTQWQFGLVDAARRERPVCADLQRVEAEENPPSLRISVIVCTFNGTATLRACLESLVRLRYPDFEVLVIDDGSTLDVASIANNFPQVRYVRQGHAGLSVARNLGASLATGEILAYTDDDCLADEDWLTYLAAGFNDPQWVAAGGPNIPPQPRNRTEAVVAAAPGAPAHVLLTDCEAEHLPGCNLAIRKAALEAIGGFRAHYRVAGDDVDICWRLREAGGKLRFMPGAMVWHHRRYTVRAYLRQQRGYGRAEALLMKDHPERFGPLGGARWFGGIYGDNAGGLGLSEGSIFHGPMGEGLFQGIYQQGNRCWLAWLGGLSWVVLTVLALLLQCPVVAALIVGFSLALAACRLLTQTRAPFALSLGESCLLLGLCWWQPVLREWQRLAGMIRLGARPGSFEFRNPHPVLARPKKTTLAMGELSFWSETGDGRTTFLAQLKQRYEGRKITVREDDGWRLFDLEAVPQRDFSFAVITVAEHHAGQGQLIRVRLLMRFSRRLLLLITTPLLAGLLRIIIEAFVFPADWEDSAESAVFSWLSWLSLFFVARHGLKKDVMQAAKAAGLTLSAKP